MTTQAFDPALVQYAQTDLQRERLEAVISQGSERKAAKFLKCDVASISKAKKAARRNAAKHNYSPEHDMKNPTPDGFYLKGNTTLYKDGEVKLQWVRTNIDLERQHELMIAAVDEMSKDIKPIKPTVLSNKTQIDELLNLYVLTDFHLGMHAWKPETGANWDLAIAEKTVIAAFKHLIGSSPNAKTGFLMQLGDFLHYDSMVPETPRSRHTLDTDSRFPKVIETAVRVLKQIVSMMLMKHEKVVLLMAKGNHDPASSSWLQVMCKVLYSDDPRIEVIVDPRSYYAYVHGEVLIGAHHGDKKTNLSLLREHFYEEFRELFGSTKRTYIHTGHLHHGETLPSRGKTKVERWPTVAARDAHGSDYASDRYMPCITYNRTSEIGRSLFYPESLGDD